MKKYALFLGVILLSSFQFTYSQVTVSGKVYDAAVNQPLAGVNIIVKGKVIGTVTDGNGNFSLTVNENPPVTLVFSFIGFESQEIVVNETNVTDLNVQLAESSILGQEIVVSASRVEETILESPVSIEKMGILEIQNTASDNYYNAIANLKGVDVATSSINFQIINTRGFASTGNTRFVQLIDGMDTQAPALNFPIGNLNGPSELDVESVELIPGASSALYGPNAFNGILLINSKSPFEYQGISAMAQLGVNHLGEESAQEPAPMYKFSFRYADAINDKFAYKVNFSYSKADDWHGRSLYDRRASINPFASIGGENPGADRLHLHGDEAAVNMNLLQLSSAWRDLASYSFSNFSNGDNALEYADNGFLPSHVVSAPAYKEENIVDYEAKNIKFNAALHYRLTDNLEVSYMANYGFGTSVYTGAQRYSLANFSIGQHRLQLEGNNFFVRAYATLENSGDSYIAEFLAKRINDKRSTFVGKEGVSNYLGIYSINYLRFLAEEAGINLNSDPSAIGLETQLNAHEFARNTTNSLLSLTEGSDTFESYKNSVSEGVVPDGPKFNDQTNLYHAEGQYNFVNEVDFMELIAGASFRIFDLNSNGTIFDDKGGVTIKEYGAYAQAAKWIANDKIKLTTSLRYDKNENFDGQFNPRISGVFKVAENHNIRASFQTGFRIPTTQGQYIDLNVLSARLLGGLPQFVEKYDVIRNSNTGVPLAYTGASVQAYSETIFSQGATPGNIFNPTNISILEPFTSIDPVKPENIKSFELGYKSLIENKFMIDLSLYYNIYNNFITQIQVRVAEEFTTNATLDEDTDPYGFSYNSDVSVEGSANYATILNGDVNNTFQIYTNEDQQISSQGAALGLTYILPKNYTLSGNYNWNVLNEEIENGLTSFNTPEHKINLSFSNRKVTDKFGFNITYRWQEAFQWESSFAVGPVPSYSTVDAQVSYELKALSSVIKLGGSNLFNKYYIQSLGGPDIGAIYYISLTFNELMN